MNKKIIAAPLLGLGGALIVLTTMASAHVSISSGNAAANTNSEVSFQVAHGCPRDAPATTNADTIKLVIDIPPGVTGVRAMPNAFGKATITATTVTYEKIVQDYLPEDTAFYRFTLRLKPPNAPFTKLYFVAHQYCNGVTDPKHNPVNWSGLPGQDAGVDEPAAELIITPTRVPGWNKYTLPADLPDFASYFKDAAIVWKGNAAHSANANTLTQIKSEPGVTELTSLKANDEIWVKY